MQGFAIIAQGLMAEHRDRLVWRGELAKPRTDHRNARANSH